MTHRPAAPFAAIIDRWPTAEVLAADLSARGLRVDGYLVRAWKRPGRVIPAEYWAPLVASAAERAIPLTLEELAAAAQSRAPRQEPADGASHCEEAVSNG